MIAPTAACRAGARRPRRPRRPAAPGAAAGRAEAEQVVEKAAATRGKAGVSLTTVPFVSQGARRITIRGDQGHRVYVWSCAVGELRMCGWGPYAREASAWEACCRYSGVYEHVLELPNEPV